MAKYKIVNILYNNEAKGFLCQSSPCSDSSAKKGCPCALLSFWNYLVLERGGPWQSKDGYKTEKEMSNHICRLYGERAAKLKEVGYCDRPLPEVVGIIRSLSAGIKMNPNFYSEKVFEMTDLLWLFLALGIPVAHGHVVDPRALVDDIRRVKSASSKASEEGLGAATDEEMSSLSLFKTQLTNLGLTRLLQCHEEGELGVLYTNGHYSVILKKEDILLTLETNEGVLRTVPDAIWKRLTVVDQDSFYLTSRFSPTKRQPNQEKADEWYNQNLKEKFGGLEDNPETSKRERRARRRLGVDEDGSMSVGGNSPCPTENKDADLPMVFEKDTAPPKVIDKDAEVSDQFLKFLMEFKDGHTKPYFEGIIEAMKFQGLFKMYVPYALIEMQDKSLAIAIRDKYPRIHNDLKKSFAGFLAHHGFEMSIVQEHAEVCILGLPRPKSTQSLVEFVIDNQLTEDYQLFGGVIQHSTSYIGRRMALGFLHFILAHHEAGVCWHGKFEECNMVIRNNGLEFAIDLDAMVNLTPAGGVADLMKYCEIIFPLFEAKNGEYPLYFNEFQTDCMNMPNPEKEPLKYGRFLKLMRSAFALKAPASRSTVICDIYTLATGRKVPGRPFIPLNNKMCLVEWRQGLRLIEPFEGVYSYKNDGYAVDKWGGTFWFLLQFSRHFIQHVLGYLKALLMLHDKTVIELMLSRQLSTFLADFVRYFVYNCDIDDMFYSAWAHFEASDCMDKAKNDVSKDGLKDQPQHGPETCTESNDDIGPLLFAVAAGSSLPCLEILIQAGADLNMKIDGATPLHIAAESASVEVIERLVGAGGDPNACNDSGLRPIQVAALRNNHEVVKLLLPSTTPFVTNWDIDGITEYTLSKAVEVELQINEATSPNLATSVSRQSVEVSSQAKNEALSANLRGNNAYEGNDYIAATEAYSQGIDLDPSNATLWSNRSLCWLRLGIAEAALKDANECRLLRPDWARACYRQGAALLELQRFYEAAIAFYEGAQLELELDIEDYVKAFRQAVEAGIKSQAKHDVTNNAGTRSVLHSVDI